MDIIQNRHSVSCTDFGSTLYDTHVHDTYEVNYINTSNVNVTIGNSSYTTSEPANIFLIPPFIPHRVEANNMIYRRKMIFFYESAVTEAAPVLKEAFKYLSKFAPFEFKLSAEDSEFFSELFNSVSSNTEMLDDWKNVSIVGNCIKRLIELHIESMKNMPDTHDNKTANDFVFKMIAYIHNHLTENITNEKIANKYNISLSTLHKIVKDATGYSPHNYIVYLKISESIKLLQQGHSVTETANLVGYSSYAHFIRAFKHITGTSPKKYLKTHSEA